MTPIVPWIYRGVRLALLAVAVLAAPASLWAAEPVGRPNVLLVITDDKCC